MLLAACSSGSDPASAVPSESAPASAPAVSDPPPSASTAPSATAQPSAGPSATADAASLPVPGFATVTADALTVREEPSLTGEPVIDRSTCIDNPNPCERPFTIGTDRGFLWVYLLDGPVSADGHDWYLAATEMNTEQHASTFPEAVGWVASGDAEDDWLVVDDRSCPADPLELPDVTNLALTKLEMLHCLGDRQLTVRGWYPPLPPGETEQTATVEECRASQPWLICASIFDLVRPTQAPWAGNADYLDFVVDPGSGVVMPDRGQWITITGSFDHPEAQSCGDAAQVLQCRFSFIVTSVEPG
jgi:hypothetical protein